MASPKTFWEIEAERTWRISILFGFLLLIYFVSIFIIWIIIKFLGYLRLSLMGTGASFHIFGIDTLIVLIIAAIVAAIHWYYSNRNIVNKVLRFLDAKYPDKYDKYHHIFQNIVDEIETAAGEKNIKRYILPTGAMNAFALADLQGKKAIGITEGLLSRLSRDELQSVVAHEMAHIVSKDCLQTTIACSLFGIYSEAIGKINRIATTSSPSSIGEDSSGGIATFFILIALFLMETLSQLLNMFISRQREYRADAAAVRLTRNPQSLASALYKIGTHWRGAGYGGEHLAPIFILSPKLNALEETENLYATLFSTHPPLIKRLEIILDIGHSDLEQIIEHITRQKKIKIVSTIIKPTIKFFVEENNNWSGPFAIFQLQTIDWLTPETKIKMSGSEDIISAREIPVLSYFFKVRNEPLRKIRRLCPDCQQWLIVQEYEGLYVWRCAFCNGILAEKEKLPRVFIRKEKGFTEEIIHLAEKLKEEAKKKYPHPRLLLDTHHPRPCPRCGKPMLHKFYSYAYRVEIDECLPCGLIWFDAEEIEILQCLIEMAETKRD